MKTKYVVARTKKKAVTIVAEGGLSHGNYGSAKAEFEEAEAPVRLFAVGEDTDGYLVALEITRK